jgi:hypothetical protein
LLYDLFQNELNIKIKNGSNNISMSTLIKNNFNGQMKYKEFLTLYDLINNDTNTYKHKDTDSLLYKEADRALDQERRKYGMFHQFLDTFIKELKQFIRLNLELKPIEFEKMINL